VIADITIQLAPAYNAIRVAHNAMDPALTTALLPHATLHIHMMHQIPLIYVSIMEHAKLGALCVLEEHREIVLNAAINMRSQTMLSQTHVHLAQIHATHAITLM